MATGDEILERPVGAIDGINRIFDTSVAYAATTVRLFWSGQLIRATDDDGFDELGGTTIELKEAPRIRDILTVRYIEQ